MPEDEAGGRAIEEGDAAFREPIPEAFLTGSGRGTVQDILGRLEAAVEGWVAKGVGGPVARWLDRELDPEGVPKRLAVAYWMEGLRGLLTAAEARPGGWPEQFDARAEGWFRALLRFCRPGGTVAFGAPLETVGDARLFRGWAERLSDPGLTTVVDWWFPDRSESRHAPPPLPADARPGLALAVLRADWARDGDLMAVDQRDMGEVALFELYGMGRVWLSPWWGGGVDEYGDTVPAARTSAWVSQSSADLYEWTFRVGPARVTRTAVLLRGRRLAVLGEDWAGAGDPGTLRLALAEGVEASAIPESRGLALTAVQGRPASARILPVGLPRLPYETPRGRFGQEESELVLRQAPEEGARRVWKPLVVSWEPKRNRQSVHWRTLTVAEGPKVCPPSVAFAARVTWGRGDTLVIYRSLARPALRSFLGYQTRARLVVALFTPEGVVEPLIKVED